MHHQGRRSLAEILAAPVRLSPQAAVAIVRELCRMPVDALMPVETPELQTARIAPGQVWLYSDGNTRLSPGVVPTVSDLGALLEQLLLSRPQDDLSPGPDQSAQLPGGLVLLTARATGQIDVEPFASLEAFATALERFDSTDPRETLRALFAAADGQMRAPLSVSAAQELTALAPRSTEELAPESTDEIGDYEYQPSLVGGTPAGEHPAPRERVRSWPRPRIWAALLTASAVAGVATAVVLPLPRGDAVRARDTEVRISPPSAVTPAPSRPVRPPISPLSAPGAGTRAQPRQTTDVASGAGATREPQLLIDRDEADADAVYSPSYAADGTALFFQAESTAGSALKRAERDERGVLHIVTIVDDAARNYHVKLSPDGRSVAFDSDREGLRGVYVARADGTKVRRVSGRGYAAVPTWAPDGTRLAFLRAEEDRPNVWNLWLLELETGETTRLTSHRYGQVWAGAWFPDGRRIAYSHEDHLILLELASGRSTSYASPRPGRLVRTPAVSPDGAWIMFQVFRDGGWLLNLESGSMQRVLDDPSAEEFTWAPDGRRVAFHSRRAGGWGLWMMAAR